MYIASFDRSNRATWRETVQITDGDDGSLIDLSDALITMTLRDKDGCEVHTLSSEDSTEIAVIDTGIFEFVFAQGDMNDICAGTYDIGVRIQIDSTDPDSDIEQLMIGTVYVREGIDRQ